MISGSKFGSDYSKLNQTSEYTQNYLINTNKPNSWINLCQVKPLGSEFGSDLVQLVDRVKNRVVVVFLFHLEQIKLHFLSGLFLSNTERYFWGNEGSIPFSSQNRQKHELQTPIEGINQRNLKIWANVAEKKML